MRFFRRSHLALPVALLLISIAACGGGGSEESSEMVTWNGNANGAVVKDADNESFTVEADSRTVVTLEGNRLSGLIVRSDGIVIENGVAVGRVAGVSGQGGGTVAAFLCTDGSPMNIAAASGSWQRRCETSVSAAPAPQQLTQGTVPSSSLQTPVTLTPYQPTILSGGSPLTPAPATTPAPAPAPAPTPGPAATVSAFLVSQGFGPRGSVNEWRAFVRNTGNVTIDCNVAGEYAWEEFSLNGLRLPRSGGQTLVIRLAPGQVDYVAFFVQNQVITRASARLGSCRAV
jgi:hypothetical protein